MFLGVSASLELRSINVRLLARAAGSRIHKKVGDTNRGTAVRHNGPRRLQVRVSGRKQTRSGRFPKPLRSLPEAFSGVLLTVRSFSSQGFVAAAYCAACGSQETRAKREEYSVLISSSLPSESSGLDDDSV
jgi:hypothetical protein